MQLEVVVATLSRTPKICWICGMIVYLEECKVDASGLPVHEDCYVAKLKVVTGRQSSDRKPPLAVNDRKPR